MKKILYTSGIIALFFFLFILTSFDQPFFVSFDKGISNVLFGNTFLIGFHFLGETITIAASALILMLVLWLKLKNYRGMILILLAIGLGRVLNQVIKNWVERPRPEIGRIADASFSFPSGHAMVGLLCLFIIAYFIAENVLSKKKAIVVWCIAIILTVLIGLSRIAESHHYATDVIAGWCIGYTWFVICTVWYEQRQRKNDVMVRTPKR